MTRNSNHTARRQQVIRIARQLSLAGGLEAMTVRAIAKATGFSTAIVSYYFKDRAELAMLVFKEALEISERRFLAPVEAGASLSECLRSLLPVDDELRDVWRTWFTFWSLTVSDATFRAEQVERTEILISRLSALLQREGVSCDDLEIAARRLFAAVLGISVQAVHDPARWPPERQFEMLEVEIDAITGGAC